MRRSARPSRQLRRINRERDLPSPPAFGPRAPRRARAHGTGAHASANPPTPTSRTCITLPTDPSLTRSRASVRGKRRARLCKPGSDLTQLTFEPDATPDFGASYSPDGTKIIFHHASADGQRDLYTMNADGTGITQLTHTPDASERWPQWAAARYVAR